MTLPVFLELVEIKAKTASVLPFILGVLFSIYRFGVVDWLNMAVFFVAMFLFNMAVDMLDNYNHYYQAQDTADYQKNTNIIGREKINPRLVLGLVGLFSVVAFMLGLYLTVRTGYFLLILGGICFAVGIFYSSGPKPLADLPLGEIFSGVTMGGLITLITVYLNVNRLAIMPANLGSIFVVALPNILWIANLMLANNLCDLAEDEANGRYTLVHYLGVKLSLKLFAAANVVAFLSVIVAVILKLAPKLWLAELLLIPFVVAQTKQLWERQVKKVTFICAVKILALGAAAGCLFYGLGIVFHI